MTAAQAVEKINKLLALSASSNPNEATNALVMARKLMAQFKLSEKDLDTPKPCKLKTLYYEDLTFSGLRNMWMLSLGRVIANYHCCGILTMTRGKSTVRTVGFVGLDDDPDLARVIFHYAVDHIRKKEFEVRRRMYKEHLYTEQYINAQTKQYVTNYGEGFAKGLKQKYLEQNANTCEETALVLVQPKQVTDYLSTLEKSKIKFTKVNSSRSALEDGYSAGYSFDPTRQIEEGVKNERRALCGSRS